MTTNCCCQHLDKVLLAQVTQWTYSLCLQSFSKKKQSGRCISNSPVTRCSSSLSTCPAVTQWHKHALFILWVQSACWHDVISATNAVRHSEVTSSDVINVYVFVHLKKYAPKWFYKVMTFFFNNYGKYSYRYTISYLVTALLKAALYLCVHLTQTLNRNRIYTLATSSLNRWNQTASRQRVSMPLWVELTNHFVSWNS